MRFDRTARVLGKFEGKITAKGELQVAQGGLCKAEIQAANVTVDGTIEGDVVASERVHLNANAKVKGNVTADKLIMAEGASLFGQVAIGAEAVKGATHGEGGRGDGRTPPPQEQPQPQVAGKK